MEFLSPYLSIYLSVYNGDIPHDVTAWTLHDIINSDCLDERWKLV